MLYCYCEGRLNDLTILLHLEEDKLGLALRHVGDLDVASSIYLHSDESAVSLLNQGSTVEPNDSSSVPARE